MDSSNKQLLSVVVPCYNEQEALPLFYDVLSKQMLQLEKYDWEVIFVNDGSKDNTLSVMQDLYDKDSRHVRIVDFSRNFGKEAGLLAGLQHAKGDYITVMDADLQDPPSYLVEMFAQIDNGYDIVGLRRVNRKGEPPIRSFFARQFYKLINKFTDVEIVDGARDYRLMTRQVVDSILELKERERFSKGLFVWVGYKTKYLEYENVERVAGETHWSFWGLFKYAIDGIVAFTTAPLKVAAIFGLLVSGLSFIYMLFIFIKAALFGDPVAGYPSMMVIILFLGGIQLLAIGILGEYLSKMYMEIKHRPNYIVKKFYEGDSHE